MGGNIPGGNFPRTDNKIFSKTEILILIMARWRISVENRIQWNRRYACLHRRLVNRNIYRQYKQKK